MYEMSDDSIGFEINVKAFFVGDDLSLTIHGGDKPHIGAVAVGFPYLNNKNKLDCSVSVVSLPGHKEYEIMIECIKRIVTRLETKVLMSCGIHVDSLEKSMIEETIKIIHDMIEKLIHKIIESND